MNIDLQKGETWLIDKPYEWTSFDVVRRLKHALIRNTGDKKAKIGHAGTLDPLATGLLIVCVGKATKQIDHIQSGKKEYTGIIRIGASTPSYDRETAVDATFDWSGITPEMIRATAIGFLGEQDQVAPGYSAKLVDGTRAYEHARKGKEIELKKHRITIDAFEITKIELPDIYFRIECSKGTYIRSIASDFGKRLNNGAYLYELRRTKSGEYNVDQAKTVDDYFTLLTGENPEERSGSKRAFLLENRKKES